MNKFPAFLLTGSLLLASCGPSAEQRQAEADRVAAEAAEQSRLAAADAAEKACLSRSAESFNQTLGKTFSVGFGALNSISLEFCPQDMLGPFASYKYALRDASTVVAAIEGNEAGADDACKAAMAISILEWLAEKDSGLTPCSDSLAQNLTLKDKLSSAVEATRSAETALRISFASHGFTDQQPSENAADAAANAM